MVAAEAMRRGFYEAAHKAVVGDGGNWIGPLADFHFPGWIQVLDFLHLLVHLYAAATAAYRKDSRRAWDTYVCWLRWAWAGQVDELLAGLEEECRRLGKPPPQASESDPRRILSLTRMALPCVFGLGGAHSLCTLVTHDEICFDLCPA
jgi:hypothetical protein